MEARLQADRDQKVVYTVQMTADQEVAFPIQITAGQDREVL